MTWTSYTPLYIMVAVMAAGMVALFWLYGQKVANDPPEMSLKTLQERMGQQQQLIDYLQGQMMTQGRQNEMLRAKVDGLEQEVARLRADNERLRATNEYLTQQLGGRMGGGKAPRASAALREALTDRINDDELRSLCFDLGVDYDNLSGTTLAARATALIAHCERHNMLEQLTEYIKRTRADIKL